MAAFEPTAPREMQVHTFFAPSPAEGSSAYERVRPLRARARLACASATSVAVPTPPW